MEEVGYSYDLAMTLSQTVDVSDSDVIKMIEEFLANRHLDIALMCLERESGIINGRCWAFLKFTKCMTRKI